MLNQRHDANILSLVVDQWFKQGVKETIFKEPLSTEEMDYDTTYQIHIMQVMHDNN